MFLTATTHTLQITTSTSQAIEYTASYIDMDGATVFTPGSNQGSVSSATTTTIVAAPGSGLSRQILHLSLVNTGASANTIAIEKDVSGTAYTITPTAITLAPGESWTYQDKGTSGTYFASDGTVQTTRKAAGNDAEIQFNDGGVLSSSSNLSYDSATNTLALAGTSPYLNIDAAAAEPATPAAGTLAIYAKTVSGRILPKWKGPSGIDTRIQPALFGNHVVLWSPQATSGTWFGSVFTAITAGAAVLPTTTNLYTMLRRSTFTAATGANTQNSIRSESMFYRGNAANIGGFFAFFRFGFSTWTANNRAFCGMTAGTTAVTTGNPSAIINIAGFGIDQGGTQWSFMHNDASGSATVVSLPAHTAVATNSAYDAYLFCKPNDSVLYYRIDDLIAGTTIADSSVSSDLPVNTTALNAHCAIGSGSNTTAGVAVLGVNKIYIETDF